MSIKLEWQEKCVCSVDWKLGLIGYAPLNNCQLVNANFLLFFFKINSLFIWKFQTIYTILKHRDLYHI